MQQIKIAKSSNHAVRIMIMFGILTAVFSAFLDNVTTILLITPVTIVIAKQLEINPVYLSCSRGNFGNIGGTATLIGDPPNIMIGSRVGFTFVFYWKFSTSCVNNRSIYHCYFHIFWEANYMSSRSILTKSCKWTKAVIKDKKLLVKSSI